MTIRQAIVQNVRLYRSIPSGSLLWLDIPGADDLIECREVRCLDTLLETFGRPKELVIHIDTPDGDFEDTFRIKVNDLKKPPAIVRKRNRAVEARNAVIARFGINAVENAESLVIFYAEYLLGKFRKSHGYCGPAPSVKTRWYTKHSWGGRKGITISPGYLYNSSGFFSFCFNEYRHISSNPMIGNFISLNRLNHIKALVAHELAHFLQCNANNALVPKLDYRKNHGEGWQYIYSITRHELNKKLSH